jgi:hypothetical protein
VQLPSGKRVWRNRTAGAGAYPEQLCQRWAKLLREAAPPSATGSQSLERVETFLSALRHAAQRPEAAGPPGPHGRQPPHPGRPDIAGEFDCERARHYLNKLQVVFGQHNRVEAERIRAAEARRAGTKGGAEDRKA